MEDFEGSEELFEAAADLLPFAAFFPLPPCQDIMTKNDCQKIVHFHFHAAILGKFN